MPAQGTWLECNGQSTAAYPVLKAIVGNNVPDYRGYFLRGYGGNSATLGTAQGDAIRNITGNFALQANWLRRVEGAFTTDNRAVTLVGGNVDGSQSSIAFDASRVVPTANENRPVNKAVRFLIKAA